MNFANSVLSVFFSMSRKEKGAAVFLFLGLLVSLAVFLIGSIRLPERLEKGTFSEGVIGQIRTIHPLFADFNEADRDLSVLVFSGLMRYDPTERNFFPDLAASWERSSDGLTYTFTLRPNALWHDGKPVTADDVIFTFRDIIQDPGLRNPILKNAFEGVAVQKTSDHTVTFILPKPNSYFLSNMTVGLLPKHLLENKPIANFEKSSFGLHPIGTGPYAVTAAKLDKDGDRIDLAAFPQYYGPKPLIPRIRILTFPDEETLLKERGAFHAMARLAPSAAATARADGRFALTEYSLNQFLGVFFNTDLPLLKDKRVRKALALGLDKQALLAMGEKRVDGLDLADHGAEADFAFDPAAANKTFDGLNWKRQDDGFRVNPKGEPVSVTLLASAKTSLKLTEQIRQMWEGLGIRVDIQRPEPEEFANLVSQRRYGALLIRQNLGYNRDVYPLFHSSQRSDPSVNLSGLNFSQFKSFQTDGLTEAMRKEKNPQDKEKLLDQLSGVLAEETPVVFLSTPLYFYALDKRIQPFPEAAVLDFHADRLRILPYLSFPSLDKLRMSGDEYPLTDSP